MIRNNRNVAASQIYPVNCLCFIYQNHNVVGRVNISISPKKKQSKKTIAKKAIKHSQN
jgi:hypothetical protein